MRLTVNAEQLTETVEKAARALPRRAIIPETAAVKVQATFDGLYITGTDTDLYIRAHCDADVFEQGIALVFPKDITQTTKYADENEKAELVLLDHKVELVCRGKTDMPIFEDSGIMDFDEVPRGTKRIELPLTNTDIKRLDITCDDNSILPVNSSIHITAADGTIRFFTVGGANSWFTYIEKECHSELKVCISMHHLKKSIAAAGPDRKVIYAERVVVEDDTTVAIFPATQLVPKDFKAWADASKKLVTVYPDYKKLIEALERGAYYTGPERGLCLYGSSGNLMIDTINGKETTIAVDGKMEGVAIDTAFNADVMIASAKSIGDGLKIELLELSRGELATNIIKLTDGISGHYLMPITHKRRM